MSDYEFLHNLEVEVETRLELVGPTEPSVYAALPSAEWQIDPTDVEREVVGLRSLIGAIESLESDIAATGLDQGV
ncbi:hypothetical protein ACWEOW_10110 [Monashia sp. NPDC004114]